MRVAPDAEILAELRRARARLRGRHEAGEGGLALVRALAASMDEAMRAIWRGVAGDGPGLALVAVGGYGRGELSPASDLDLMVLHDGSWRAGDVSEGVFYPLWDAGFTVGHATRTVKEALRLARDNIEAETSFLHARAIAGDQGLVERFAMRALEGTRKRRDAFARDVRRLMTMRHALGGSATSQLEPNIKEGAGGLRDLHVLGWFERVFASLDDVIAEPERARIDAAAELLHRVRNHLHYTTERPTDALLFQHQRPVALFLGYADRDRAAEDAFMRDLFDATRSIEQTVIAVVAELCARGERSRPARSDGPFAVEAGRVVVARAPDLVRAPEHAVDLFALGAPPGADALHWLQSALADVPELPWTEEVRRSFLRLIRTGDPRMLELADHAGVFARLLPEWDAVRCQPQRNVYHRYTVDAHLFETVAQLRALEIDGDDLLARQVLGDITDRDALLLAALLHDVGKGADEDHSERGERLATRILERMGIAEPRRSEIAWLVRHHLLLVDSATRRDLNDENLVIDIAARIGRPERARMLYVLSVADGRATGPTAWTPWKANLVRELFTKALRVIERGEVVSTGSVELARRRAAELRTSLTRYPADLVDRHIETMPRAYILAFPTMALTRHFALMAEPLEALDARTHVLHTEEPGVYELTVVTKDRPGVFAKVSGVLALHGVNIVTSQGYTRADGTALEVFRCVGGFAREVEDDRWERVAEDVRKALRGKLSIEVRLAEKRRAYRRPVPKGKAEPPKVIVDNDASDFLTVVEVHAPDRIGLLYDITSAFADLGLDIQVAKVSTYGEDVVDAFYVRDLDGQKIDDPEHLAEIERTLLHRLDPSRS